MSSWMGWIPQHIPGEWAELVLLLAELAFLFPAAFIPFFHLLGTLSCLCLGVDTPGITYWRGVQGFTLPSPKQSLPRISICCSPSSHHLYDPSPSSLSIFSQLLSLPKELSEVGVGFNLLENGDFAASCASSNDRVGSGFRTWPRFYFAASNSRPLILNHLTDSLEQIDAAFQEKPNHSQITWHEVLQSGGVDHL